MSDSPYRLVRTERPVVAAPVLDDAQRAVLAHAGGPLLVLAGPGTGKTTTLIETVAARATSGVPVEQILMLTFSRRAAHEMRDRVAARLGSTLREPVARTLHSYAFGILRIAAAMRGEPTPRLLTAAEQDVVIRELLREGDPSGWPAALRPALQTFGFADELRALLTRAVERSLDGPTLASIGTSRGRPDWVAAGHFLTEYQGVTVFRDPGGFDPAELIQGALNTLQDEPELLAAERGRRRRIFVDEYQDTDPAQADLLQLLADGADELVLVGDPDQSIYAFRGADEAAVRDVDDRFGAGARVPVVALGTCRRSGPVLLAASRRLAARLPGRAEQRAVVPVPGAEPGEVEVSVFRTASEEAAHLAAVLRAEHLAGVPWSRMAVLLRSTGTMLGPLRRAMITAGVPVSVGSDDLPLAEQPAVELLLTLLGCALDPTGVTEDVAENLLIGPLGGGDTLYLRRLRRALRRQFPDEEGLLVPALADHTAATTLGDELRGPLQRVARVLAAGTAAVGARASTEQILWDLWNSSDLGRQWENASRRGRVSGAAADRDLDAVVALFEAAGDFTDRLPHLGAAEFRDFVSAQQIPGASGTSGGSDPDSVAVLTAHAAKGLEWDVVCVAHVQEGTWPDLRRRGSLLGVEALVDALAGIDAGVPVSRAPQLAEERRLFYVAATRARRRLVVTAVAGDDDQPSRLLDELDPTDGTRPLRRQVRGVHLPGLVAELRAAVCDPDVPADVRATAAGQLSRLAAERVAGADPDEWWGLAELSTTAPTADPDVPVRVSPSRVEGFFECELRALMSDLGVRDDTAIAASLGTAIHELAAYAPPDQTLEQFEQQLSELWGSLDFGASWFATNERVRATAMLERLVSWLRSSRVELELVASERSFAVTVGDALLTGRVDRLERDTQGRLVVVDLKTGRNKASELESHPQLGTYQLAIESGAFPDAGSVAGGGLLVQLGGTGDVVQSQGPLGEAADPQWARAAVEHVVERMRGAEFTAMENKRCHVCEVRSSCPLQITGRQVP